MPMVHLTMGEIISSYKQLMNNPVTSNTWQTAFWKGFQKYVPGRKTGAKGTNAMFVMKPEEVNHVPAARLAMYANIAVNYQPQNNDQYQICITVGGNLINYPGELTRCTADIMTSKLTWNSILSTQQAKYMCLNLKNFYLLAPLDQYKLSPLVCSLHG